MPALSRAASTVRGAARSFRRLARSSARKPAAQIVREIAACYRADGHFPRQYLLNQLYHRDVADPARFVAQEDLRCLQEAGARSHACLILDDKLHFHQFYRDSAVPIPRLLSYCFQERFFLGEEVWQVDSKGAFQEVVAEFARRSATGRAFAKPIGGSKGERVCCLRADMPAGELDRAWQALRCGSFVVEEGLAQHPALARIFPRALNTIRIIGGALPDGEVCTVSALIRFGVRAAYVDNASQGGVFAPIDLTTGRIRGPARRFFEHGGGRFPTHPDTGEPLEGVEVPFFREAVAVTEEALRMLPTPVVGWDVGITPEGPVLVEGNGHPHLVGAELAEGGYRGNAAFAALVAAYRRR